MRENLNWNRTWINSAIFVFKDPRTHVRVKLLANCYYDASDITDVLNLAWRFGYSFHLFIPLEDVGKFGNFPVSVLDRLTLPRMYDVGYMETFLTWGHGGAALYAAYLICVKGLLERPHAVAFIYQGGIVAALAQVLDPDLIYRFVQGPSVQVTEYAKGETFLQRNPPSGEPAKFYTTDQVTQGEILLLSGHIPGGGPGNDMTLFPPPSVFEGSSNHYRGMISSGVMKILENILKDIEGGMHKWRTVAQWKRYLKQNNRGENAPAHTPQDKDFDEVGYLMRMAFPINWQQLPLREIDIPEVFDPRAPR
ncbi:hypothetical protein DFH09DRAFT_940136 [Mycena vulgaris]|nr:hypothetical protein DFH09DRAFT_940136 [Mycena vulgaris]